MAMLSKPAAPTAGERQAFRAAALLGIAGDARSMQLLCKLAQGGESPLTRAARAALARRLAPRPASQPW